MSVLEGRDNHPARVKKNRPYRVAEGIEKEFRYCWRILSANISVSYCLRAHDSDSQFLIRDRWYVPEQALQNARCEFWPAAGHQTTPRADRH